MASGQQDNYFTWDNFDEISDIQSHISYATSLINKYQWEPSVRESLQKQLNSILAKQNDKTLNISVIGEFSTGKSSFINALVGYELLAVNVLQGTTVAITIIEYGVNFSITLVEDNNESTIYEYDNIGHLRDALQHYTTDPLLSNTVNYVKVTLPSEALKKGFRIIDTPGTNSLEQWHEDITRRAINDISDLSIILMDSARPMPVSLIEFVDSTIGKSVSDCIFIANKIDVIKPKEREKLIKYIQQRVSISFNIDDSIVLPFSSLVLTSSFSNDGNLFDDESKEITLKSLQFILNFTSKKRIKAQSRKLLQLIENIYSSLDSNVRGIVKHYQDELSFLEKSKQNELGAFIEHQISLRQKQFIASAQEYKSSIEQFSDGLIKDSISFISDKVTSTVSLDGLSSYIKKGDLTSDIKYQGDDISKKLDKKFNKLKLASNKQLKSFQKEFEQEFQRLKILPIKIDVVPRDIKIRHDSHSANIGPVVSLVSEKLAKENWAFGGGLVGGAAIGSLILGPVGGIIGGLIGGMVGAGKSPDLFDVQLEVISKLSTPLTAYYNSICSDCIMNLDLYINDLNDNIASEIKRYHSKYNDDVQKRIEKWKGEYDKATTKMRETEKELILINNRKEQIQNIITNINS